MPVHLNVPWNEGGGGVFCVYANWRCKVNSNCVDKGIK